MDNAAVVEQIVRNLSFEVEAVPENVIQLTGTSRVTPLNVKIRVRKKDDSKLHQDILALPKVTKPNAPPQRIRLVSSEQTIMSFNVIMEDSDCEKPVKSSQKPIFKSICLGTDTSSQNFPYIPSSVYKDTDGSVSSQSDGALKKRYGSRAELKGSPTFGKKNNMDIFGICKPGGCLDPPFGEDKHPYESANNIIVGQEHPTKTRKSSSIFSHKLFKKKRKSKSDRPSKTINDINQNQNQSIHSSSTYSNSILTYPSPSEDSDQHPQEKRLSKNVEESSFYIPPKKDRKKSISLDQVNKTSGEEKIQKEDISPNENVQPIIKKSVQIDSEINKPSIIKITELKAPGNNTSRNEIQTKDDKLNLNLSKSKEMSHFKFEPPLDLQDKVKDSAISRDFKENISVQPEIRASGILKKEETKRFMNEEEPSIKKSKETVKYATTELDDSASIAQSIPLEKDHDITTHKIDDQELNKNKSNEISNYTLQQPQAKENTKDALYCDPLKYNEADVETYPLRQNLLLQEPEARSLIQKPSADKHSQTQENLYQPNHEISKSKETLQKHYSFGGKSYGESMQSKPENTQYSIKNTPLEQSRIQSEAAIQNQSKLGSIQGKSKEDIQKQDLCDVPSKYGEPLLTQQSKIKSEVTMPIQSTEKQNYVDKRDYDKDMHGKSKEEFQKQHSYDAYSDREAVDGKYEEKQLPLQKSLASQQSAPKKVVIQKTSAETLDQNQEIYGKSDYEIEMNAKSKEELQKQYSYGAQSYAGATQGKYEETQYPLQSTLALQQLVQNEIAMQKKIEESPSQKNYEGDIHAKSKEQFQKQYSYDTQSYGTIKDKEKESSEYFDDQESKNMAKQESHFSKKSKSVKYDDINNEDDPKRQENKSLQKEQYHEPPYVSVDYEDNKNVENQIRSQKSLDDRSKFSEPQLSAKEINQNYEIDKNLLRMGKEPESFTNVENMPKEMQDQYSGFVSEDAKLVHETPKESVVPSHTSRPHSLLKVQNESSQQFSIDAASNKNVPSKRISVISAKAIDKVRMSQNLNEPGSVINQGDVSHKSIGIDNNENRGEPVLRNQMNSELSKTGNMSKEQLPSKFSHLRKSSELPQDAFKSYPSNQPLKLSSSHFLENFKAIPHRNNFESMTIDDNLSKTDSNRMLPSSKSITQQNIQPQDFEDLKKVTPQTFEDDEYDTDSYSAGSSTYELSDNVKSESVVSNKNVPDHTLLSKSRSGKSSTDVKSGLRSYVSPLESGIRKDVEVTSPTRDVLPNKSIIHKPDSNLDNINNEVSPESFGDKITDYIQKDSFALSKVGSIEPDNANFAIINDERKSIIDSTNYSSTYDSRGTSVNISSNILTEQAEYFMLTDKNIDKIKELKKLKSPENQIRQEDTLEVDSTKNSQESYDKDSKGSRAVSFLSDKKMPSIDDNLSFKNKSDGSRRTSISKNIISDIPSQIKNDQSLLTGLSDQTFNEPNLGEDTLDSFINDEEYSKVSRASSPLRFLPDLQSAYANSIPQQQEALSFKSEQQKSKDTIKKYEPHDINDMDKNQSLKSEYKQENDLKTQDRKPILKKDAPIIVDLGFHSFVNDNNERIIKTFDSALSKKYSNDTMFVAKYDMREPFELRVPTDTENYLSIKLESNKTQLTADERLNTDHSRNRVLLKDAGTSEESVYKSKFLDRGEEKNRVKIKQIETVGDELQFALNELYRTYEKELIPLQDTITELKKDIEHLTKQQSLYKETLMNKKLRRIRSVSTKRCGCIKKM